MATLTIMRVVRHAPCQGGPAGSLRCKETHFAVVRAFGMTLWVLEAYTHRMSSPSAPDPLHSQGVQAFRCTASVLPL